MNWDVALIPLLVGIGLDSIIGILIYKWFY